MGFVRIDAGEFIMGSEATDADADDDEFVDKTAGRKEKHRVRITNRFTWVFTRSRAASSADSSTKPAIKPTPRRTARGVGVGTRKRRSSGNIPAITGRIQASSRQTSTRW